MKDLTHYFSESVKSKESSNEVKITDPAPTTIIEETRQNRKRGRVKIKIRHSNTRGKVCDIVESKNDLIDKTPSPFVPTALKEKVPSPDATPKRLESHTEASKISIKNGTTALDSSYEIFSPRKAEKPGKIVREESNAFELLMTRSKSVKYIDPKQLSTEEEIAEVERVQESRTKLKQTKEKIIALANKRGYSKRKALEQEEDEKIMNRVQNRIRMFTKTTTIVDSEASASKSSQKTLSGGLHNYFSKQSTEEHKKTSLIELSTAFVEAEISEGTQNGSVKPLKQKTRRQTGKSKTRKVLEVIDDMQEFNSDIGAAPTAILPIPVDIKPSTQPKSTLRINMPSSQTENTVNDEGSEVGQNRVKSRKRRGGERLRAKKSSQEPPTAENTVEDAKDVTTGDKSSEKAIVHAPTTSSEGTMVENRLLKRPPNEKLAPLFIKRPKPDPEVLAARRLFLQSGTPEPEAKSEPKSSRMLGPAILPFPVVSHVTQLGTVDLACSFEVKLRPESSLARSLLDVSTLKCVTALDDALPVKNIDDNPAKADVEDVLREIEEKCADVRDMWKRISMIAAKKSVQATPRKPGRRRKSVEKVAKMEDVDYNVWTQKFRPMSANEVVGNEAAATKLKNWLTTWRAASPKDDYSSGEEFYSSDSGMVESNQVAVLIGPHGSGKTASVYAIAAELDYSVLEINASSRRTGKKILRELEEATKSHRVKKSDLFSVDVKKIPQNSLILIEDVDLVFDEDEGFVSAAYQLALNTKRPIAMTCRDSCSHLSRMAPGQLRISFQSAAGFRTTALFQLIALAETGIQLSRPFLDKLLINGDLRNSLLQLQYFLLSGTAQLSELSINFRNTLWQDSRASVYKPACKLTKKRGKKNHAEATKIIESLANDLDTISLVSSLVEVDEDTLNMSRVKFEPCLSLSENTNLYSSVETAQTDIGEWLRHQVMQKNKPECDDIDVKLFKKLCLKKELNSGVDCALWQASTTACDRRNVAVDYLPVVRTICRAEDEKSTHRRSNRYFHYLQNLRISCTSLKPSILSAACKILQEKPEKISKPP